MVTKFSEHYEFQFYDNYVIAEAKEGVVISNEEIKKNLRIIFDHYNGKNFTIISHRKNNYTVEIDVYATRLMKKVKALAIVSSNSQEREKAILEQLQFDNSFAFFNNLEDAKLWAQSATVS
jgi:predicted HAD superfamily phosphohydrolase YqeG